MKRNSKSILLKPIGNSSFSADWEKNKRPKVTAEFVAKKGKYNSSEDIKRLRKPGQEKNTNPINSVAWPKFEDWPKLEGTNENEGDDKTTPAMRNGGALQPVRKNLECWKSTSLRTTSYLDFPISSESELAIHPKKLEELKNWLRTSLGVTDGIRILLLTGPSGSGKSTSIRFYCEQFGIELFEYDNSQEYGPSSSDDLFKKSSVQDFVSFMQHCCYPTIKQIGLSNRKRRLILIDQLPISYYKNPATFHEFLRNLVKKCRNRIVIFALSHVDSCWELSHLKLFNSLILEQLRIKQIKFNAVSNSLMTKAVKRLLNSMGKSTSQDFIRQIVDLAEGDIRKAVNSIAFSAVIPQTSSSKTSQHLELFHFLGKIMYAKRAEKADNFWTKCEDRLVPRLKAAGFGRKFPPKDDINQLISTSYVSGSFLSGYVSEHEPKFANSIRSLKRVTTRLAECDAFLGNFEHAQQMDKYVLDITIRSTIFNNSSDLGLKRPRMKGLYEFTKPSFRQVEESRRETHRLLSDLYMGERLTQLKTIILPTFLRTKSFCQGKLELELFKRISFNPDTLLCRYLPTLSPQISVDYEIPDATPPNLYSQSLNISYQMDSSFADDDGFNYDIEE